MSRRRSSNKTPKKVFTKLKWHVSEYIKIGTSLHCKKAKTKLKECKKDWEILVMSKADKGLIFRIYKKLTCLLRNLYAGQEATVRTGDGTTDWFQIGKGVHQGCILSPCLFNFYAQYITRNAGVDEAQAGMKIARGNINNLR